MRTLAFFSAMFWALASVGQVAAQGVGANDVEYISGKLIKATETRSAGRARKFSAQFLCGQSRPPYPVPATDVLTESDRILEGALRIRG